MSIFDFVSKQPDPEIKQDSDTSQPKVSSIFDAAEKIELSEPDNESYIGAGLRHAGRSALALREMGWGLLGNIAEPVRQSSQFIIEKTRGKPFSPKEEEDQINFRKKFAPTSEEYRQFHEEKFPSIRKTRGPGEEQSDRIVQDTASILMSPIKGLGWIGNSLRALGIVSGSEGVKEGVKALGGSEGAQEVARTGSQFLFSLWNPKGAKDFISSLYNRRDAALPQGAMGDATRLEKNLLDLRNKMTKGTLAPSEKAIADEIDLILPKVKNGKMTYEEALAAKRSINEKSQQFLFQNPDKTAKARARKFYKSINKELDGFIDQSKDALPEFYKLNKEANQAFGVFEDSRKISNFIAKNKAVSSLVGSSPVLGALFTGNIPGIATSGAVLATGTAGLKTGELAYRVAKSPVLRKYYVGVVKSAAQQNAEQTIRNLQKLQKGIEDDPELSKFLQE